MPPKLEIIEQPEKTTYFRNESEVEKDKHGRLKGINSNKKQSKTTYPKVKLLNYESNNDILIICQPYCAKKEFPEEKNIHPYRLIKQSENMLCKNMKDPLELYGNSSTQYECELEATIMIPGKNSKYKREEMDFNKKDWDFKKLYLCFEAFEYMDGQIGNRICEKIFSNPIGNQRSTETSKLEIKDITVNYGNPQGNTRIWLLCERVSQDVRVKFSEINSDWIAYGKNIKIHHQYVIIFDTPPYKDITIKTSVFVDIQLERESDKTLSEKYKFEYRPSTGKYLKKNASKRKSTTENYLEFVEKYSHNKLNEFFQENQNDNQLIKIKYKCTGIIIEKNLTI